MTAPLDRIPVATPPRLTSSPVFDRLDDLAYNMWWTWNRDARDLWRSIDGEAWSRSPNPVPLLQGVSAARWSALESNPSFIESYLAVVARFDAAMQAEESWFEREHHDRISEPIAYLSAEYGIHHKLRLYSGGLGVLSGDHLKAASDLGVPLVAVGLLYRRGYFQQAVDPDGRQQHTFLRMNTGRLPLRRVLDPETGRPLSVPIDFPDRQVGVTPWLLAVGRVPLLLLDTDLVENDPADRAITHILYVRGREMRLSQELVLGVGAVRILVALGIEPSVWHVNEGHAALSILERLADPSAGEDHVVESTVFTLHTPVPAGNEVFSMELALPLLASAVPTLGGNLAGDMAAGPQPGWFDLGALAIRHAGSVNGVSDRHAEIVNHDWKGLLRKPAPGITNGVHSQTWVGPSFAALFQKLFGHNWAEFAAEPEAWEPFRDVPADDVWDAHVSQKTAMVDELRARLLDQFARHGAGPERLRRLQQQLSEDRLTIGFGRRFATYKRANLLFSDPSRLAALVTDTERPVQIVLAGKAHPADREGQSLIRWVVEMASTPELEGHIFFVENYDLALGAVLVQGVDVWLNTPMPPKEASGTSGMKAAANGAINLSVLDGWWLQGYNGKNGWAFGENPGSDARDARALYSILEEEIVPAFYRRDHEEFPDTWVSMMKESIVSILPRFSAQRMVRDYVELAYLPAVDRPT